MSSGSKLGRNPFQKAGKPVQVMPVSEAVKDSAQGGASEKSAPHDASPRDLGSALAQFALVDIPANAFMLGLKVFLLARETFSNKRNVCRRL